MIPSNPRLVWNSWPISKKLASVVWSMAILVLIELLTLFLMMRALSAVRAFVGGEGLWSKSQKNAIHSIHKYATSGDEKAYADFLKFMNTPLRDREARSALERAKPDPAFAYRAFLAAGNPPQDLSELIWLFKYLSRVEYGKQAIQVWNAGDALIDELMDRAATLNEAIRSKGLRAPEARPLLGEIDTVNDRLTKLEEQFSSDLAEGSRSLESFMELFSVFLVLTVGISGLALSALLGRDVTRGLDEAVRVMNQVARGDFNARVPIRSEDDIGRLGMTINRMTETLHTSINSHLRAELELRVRDEFISTASHELKTPITGLRLQVDLGKRLLRNMKSEAEISRKLASSFELADRQLNRLSQLIDNLLDVSRIRDSDLQLNFREVDLSEALEELVSQFLYELEQARCRLSLKIAPGIRARADLLRFEQVVSNLIANAVKYAPGSDLEIELRLEGDTALLALADSGPGIAPDQLPRVFDRFHRANPQSGIQGLGLGLYLVSEIVKAHGGSVQVKSELGAGTTFLVRWPLSLAQAVAEPESLIG